MPTLSISGVGINQQVEVPSGSSLDVALSDANVDTDSLQVSVNGERVSEPAQHEVQAGDTVVVVPRNAKLG